MAWLVHRALDWWRSRRLKHVKRPSYGLGQIGSGCGAAPQMSGSYRANIDGVLFGNVQNASHQLNANCPIDLTKSGNPIKVDK